MFGSGYSIIQVSYRVKPKPQLIQKNHKVACSSLLFQYGIIAIKFSIGKLTLPLPIDEWYSLARMHSGIVIESLNPLDAIASTQLPDNFHKDPADRIIVAIARRYGIPLVTCDAKILNYPHVQTIW
ncbi:MULTISPECIES: type II toxin-antitoxin system VapC family toxin [unclassified Nostoc]|uniref:type II toxin-antitoxin system VapC family toxin n=1 Tax=unclassified Nostoc TaxID=2593658 RepID=UPI001D15A2CD|nr:MULTISPECIES: type II toxin-antitoxin system VapC family toxin [unclassified Nostoc]